LGPIGKVDYIAFARQFQGFDCRSCNCTKGVISGVTRGLSQGKKLPVAERGALPIVGTPLAKTQKKAWQLMVSPDVDGYTKTLNHLKPTWKNAKKYQPT